ncbi:MAG: NEL-type E3 ubiquitin ligase domain-containing protein, partial [Gammaproteobacteria bacterium]
GGYFDLSDCIGLNALPNWVATLGRACNGSLRCITLSGCGLSETVLNRLREQNNPNVQFIFGHAAQQHQEFVSFTDALNSWVPEEMHTDLLYHDWQLSAGQEAQLMTFLSRLHQTAEAQNRTTKPSLQYRVQSFLSQMKDNRDDYRALALERISQGLESCDDGVILIMNDIEKLTRIRQASLSENPEAALRELGQSLLALDVVQRHAAAKCARSLFVDPVEVYLALEIRLADELNLPVSTRHMLFERCANLTERDIEAAKQEALSVISNPQNTQNYLERWAPWKRYQRLQQIAHLSWDQLPTSHKSFELNEVCAISGARLDALQDPICVGQTLYSLKSFLTWWGEHGTDPVTRLSVGISSIHALHVTPATLHKSAYSDLRDSGNG